MIPRSGPVRIALTGGAGAVGSHFVFELVRNPLRVLGTNQPIDLRILEIPSALGAAEGVLMEARDFEDRSFFRTLVTSDPVYAFEGAHYVVLAGARPRTGDMTREQLFDANVDIFLTLGLQLNRMDPEGFVIGVGNPANTTTLAALLTSELPSGMFTSMMMLDEARLRSRIAEELGTHPDFISQAMVWGDHGETMVPDAHFALVDGERPVYIPQREAWLRNTLVNSVRGRGKAIIDARGSSSAASAAAAISRHIRFLHQGTPSNDWTSMGVLSRGEYGMPEGVISGFPVRVRNGMVEIVRGLELTPFHEQGLATTGAALEQQRAGVEQRLAALRG